MSLREMNTRHPLLRWRPWLQLLPGLLPFMLLGVLSLGQAGLRPPPHRTLHSVLTAYHLLGMDSSGQTYFFSAELGLSSLDVAGRERWSIGLYDLFASEMFAGGFRPAFARLQEQVDGGIVLESADGPLLCVDNCGFISWRFDPRTQLPQDGDDKPVWLASRLPPEQVPAFSCWHDRDSTLYALDRYGNLLWATEAWPDVHGPGRALRERYGEKDGWSDGSLLVTLRRPDSPLDGNGDYLLRRVLRNGSTQDLWRIDLHGRQAPPVMVGETVLCQEDIAHGLQLFRAGRQLRGFNVLHGFAWDSLPDGWVQRELDRGLSGFDNKAELQWHYPERGLQGQVLGAGDGRCYYLTRARNIRGPLEHWPAALAVQHRLRQALRLEQSGMARQLSCIGGQGELEWQARLESDLTDNIFVQSGDWLAVDSGWDLLLYRVGTAGE